MAKNSKMQQTTGKVYRSEGSTVYCKTCGLTFSSDADKCPDCGGKESVPYHQTEATIPARVRKPA